MIKRFAMFALASGIAMVAATPASATLCIGVAANGGAITNVGCDGGTGSVNYNTTTGGYFYNVSATGSPLLTSPTLLTQSVNIQSQGGANAIIDVYVTQAGNTTYTGSLLSSFTSNTITGVSAELTSYYSTSNALFTGTQLQNATFSSPGISSAANALGTVTGPWSETVRYRLTFTGGNGSNFNGTVNVSAVPEAATWGMMILGFGLVGGALRRRSTKIALA